MENAITPSLIVMYVRFFICQCVQYVQEKMCYFNPGHKNNSIYQEFQNTQQIDHDVHYVLHWTKFVLPLQLVEHLNFVPMSLIRQEYIQDDAVHLHGDEDLRWAKYCRYHREVTLL